MFRTVALAVLLVPLVTNTSTAGFISFSDRSVWETAVGTPTLTENFDGFAGDTSFVPSPLALNGMTLQADADVLDPTFESFVDAPPIVPAGQDVNGTAHAVGRVIDHTSLGITNWRLDFSTPATAWGADFRQAGIVVSGPLVIDVVDQGNSLLGTLAANAVDLQFLGFQLDMGQTADHLIFRSDPAAGQNGVDAFGMDNIALVSASNAVPEPSTLTLWSLGAVALIGLTLRRRMRAA